MEKFNIKTIFGGILKYGVPLAIGICLFYWLYDNVDIDEMKQILRYDVNYFWIGLMLVISTFSHIFRAMRWRLQLQALGINAPLGALIVSIFGTYAVNLIFPRLGEVWRCGYISKRQSAPFTKVVGSMVADRLSDTATVLLLTVVAVLLAGPAFDKFFTTFPQVKDSLWNMLHSPALWVSLVLGIALIIAIFRFGKNNSIIIKVREIVSNLWQGFASIGKMEHKWRFIFYTCAIWGCYFIQLYVCFFAFEFTKDLGIICALVCFVLSSISMGIPTNGGLGAWHMAIIFGLSLYGVGQFSVSAPDARASAFAMLVWGTQNVLLILLGIYTYLYITVLDKHKDKVKEGNDGTQS